MKFTVVWKPSAEEHLARLWTETGDRDSVRHAADEIDRLLQVDPTEQGESRSRTIRVMFIDPLGVFYHISEPDRLVSVLRVWTVS